MLHLDRTVDGLGSRVFGTVGLVEASIDLRLRQFEEVWLDEADSTCSRDILADIRYLGLRESIFYRQEESTSRRS